MIPHVAYAHAGYNAPLGRIHRPLPRNFPASAAWPNRGMNPACAMPVASSRTLFGKAIMLVTLVAVLCNGQLCLERVVTTSEQSGITMMSCQVQGQIGIADWLANGPYHEWTLQSYKCVMGQYTPKQRV
jgi:hypothetical protein